MIGNKSVHRSTPYASKIEGTESPENVTSGTRDTGLSSDALYHKTHIGSYENVGFHPGYFLRGRFVQSLRSLKDEKARMFEEMARRYDEQMANKDGPTPISTDELSTYAEDRKLPPFDVQRYSNGQAGLFPPSVDRSIEIIITKVHGAPVKYQMAPVDPALVLTIGDHETRIVSLECDYPDQEIFKFISLSWPDDDSRIDAKLVNMRSPWWDGVISKTFLDMGTLLTPNYFRTPAYHSGAESTAGYSGNLMIGDTAVTVEISVVYTLAQPYFIPMRDRLYMMESPIARDNCETTTDEIASDGKVRYNQLLEKCKEAHERLIKRRVDNETFTTKMFDYFDAARYQDSIYIGDNKTALLPGFDLPSGSLPDPMENMAAPFDQAGPLNNF